MRTAVNRIVENSTEQAENSKSTSEHMRLMGDNITETSAEVEALNSNAAFMHESSEKAAETLANLQRINGRVEQITEKYRSRPTVPTILSSRFTKQPHLSHRLQKRQIYLV